ncbi:MAG: preprotein translocase subunit YajC, partial [Nocardiopsis sp. BM-2018]
MQGIYTLAAAAQGEGSLFGMLLPFALILLVFWLL